MESICTPFNLKSKLCYNEVILLSVEITFVLRIGKFLRDVHEITSTKLHQGIRGFRFLKRKPRNNLCTFLTNLPNFPLSVNDLPTPIGVECE